MNTNDYRKAMDHISPSNELKERIMHKKTTHRRYVPVHRVLASILTAVLMLTYVTTVALAASPELRRALRSSSDGPDISNAEIGGLVKAQYIKMDQRYGLSGGLLNNLTWSDDGRTLLEAGFWEIKDNNLVPVQ